MTDPSIRQWKENHALSAPNAITPKIVSFVIPTLDDLALSVEEVIQTKHLLVLLVWRIVHSRSLTLLESSVHVLHELCKTDLINELCCSLIHPMLCVTLCDALLQKDATSKKRFFENSISLTSDALYLLSTMVEYASINTLLPLEFVYVLPEIMMDRVISLHITICSLHIFNILIAQAVQKEPISIENVRTLLHRNSQPEQTPYDEFGGDMFSESPADSPLKLPRRCGWHADLRSRSEGRDMRREELLMQMNRVRLFPLS